ncbi:type III PLP-dependent enzyme [Streptomyces canus]|uniref:type III PLP-dependent enzyme n=1 Tax=Streptomyces canus TaxID=58343 RepID=UPI0036C1DAA5
MGIPEVVVHDEMTKWADRYGTPLYIYRLEAVREAATALLRSIPEEACLYYSLKANPHPALVRELVSLGIRAEVSSTGELAAALTAGTPTAEILFTGPGKTDAALREAVGAGVRRFSVESAAERTRLAAAARARGARVEYLVRVNAATARAGGVGLRMTGTPSQFGIDADQLDTLPKLFAADDATRPFGFHLFPATNITDPSALHREFEASAATVAELMRRTEFEPSMVDLGGGFAAPFAKPGPLPDYAGLRRSLSAELDRHLPGWREGRPAVAFESGRYLAAACGTLLTTVLEVKRSGGRTYAVLDAGTHVLGGMAGLGRILAPGAEPEPVGTPENEPVSLVGPLCTPLDVLSRAAVIGPVEPGDVLCIPNTGAYGLSASLLGFLSHPVAAEVVLDGDRDIDTRQLRLTPVALKASEGSPI